MFSVPNCDQVVSSERHLGEPPHSFRATPRTFSQPTPFHFLVHHTQNDLLQYSTFPCPAFPRLEKHGAATGVDIICTYHSDLGGPGLDREQLYWELSHQTQGVTRLGSFTLDRDSLHINGEGLICSPDLFPCWGFVWLLFL